MFLFKASVVKELEKFYPKLVEYYKNSLDKSENDLDFQRLNKIILNNAKIFRLTLP